MYGFWGILSPGPGEAGEQRTQPVHLLAFLSNESQKRIECNSVGVLARRALNPEFHT